MNPSFVIAGAEADTSPQLARIGRLEVDRASGVVLIDGNPLGYAIFGLKADSGADRVTRVWLAFDVESFEVTG